MPAGDGAYPWDVTFSITGGSEYGFMLVTPKGETKQIDFTEAGGPEPERVNTQAIAVSRDFDPRTDTPFAMADFSGGAGQREFDFNNDNMYWWSSGVVSHVNGKIYPAPPASSLALASSTGDITGMRTHLTSANVRYDFLWESTNLWRRDASNSSNAWSKVYVASNPITNFQVMDGVGLICVPAMTGTTDFFYQSNVTAAATWTPTAANHTPFSDALGKPSFFRQIRGTCYAMVSNNKVFYTTDPTIDGWAGPIDTTLDGNISGPPGDDSYPFIGSNAVGDFLFLRKKDAIYSIDSSQDVLEIIWQWKDKPSEYNFKYADTGGDLLTYSIGPEVYTYDPTTGINAPMGLARKDGFSTKEILGVASDNQYVYVLARVRVPVIRSADSVALFRCVKQRGNLWSFEVLWEDTDLTSQSYSYLAAMPSGVGTRLYWGLNDAGDTDTLLMDIPAEWDETQSASFATTASIWTSISRSGFPGFTKRHLYFNTNGQNLSGTNYYNIYYSVNGGGLFNLLDDATADQTEVNFVNENGLSILFRFDFVSAGTVAPTLLNFDHHQRVRFKYLPAAKLAIRIAPSLEVRNRGVSNRAVWEIWADILTLRQSNAQILYKDFLGNEFNVTVDLVGVRPTRHPNPTEYEEEAMLLITRADRGV